MPSYFKELQRRNVFRVVAAYIVLGWILLQVSTNLEEALNLPEWFDAVVTALIVIGFPVAVIISWVYELTPEGLQKTADIDSGTSVTPETGKRLNYITTAGVVVLIAITIADRLSGPTSEEVAPVAATEQASESGTGVSASERSIAVLPFVAMTTSKEDEFFADGLSEELLNVLAKNEDLKVAGRTSSFYYKGKNEDLRVIANSLGVAHILEGSVRRSGSQIRVTAQLIKAEDGFHVWSETYDRSDGDIFLIQDEISRSVSNALQAKLFGEDPNDAAPRSDDQVEAQNLYLVAQAAVADRTLPNLRRARDQYAQASILDPENPKYLAGYAAVVALQYWNFRDVSSAEAIREAGDAIEKALSLEDPSADTLAIAGLVEELRAQTRTDLSAKDRALRYYQRAVNKEPNNVLALQWLASIYLDINQPENAIEYFEKVVRLDPLNTLSLTGIANAQFALGRLDEARLHLYKMQTLFPDQGIVYRYLADIEYQSGRMDRSLVWMNKAIDADPNPLEISFALYAYTIFGWADQALDTAERFNETNPGFDISHLVQAQLDQDYATVSSESKLIYSQVGESRFAISAAWADAVIGRCNDSVTALEKQFPSLKGEVIEYVSSNDLIDAVLLAHCYAVIGSESESERLISALIASDMLSDQATRSDRSLQLVRVAARAVLGDVESALSGLRDIDTEQMPLGISPIALPLGQNPVFESLYDQAEFQEFAKQERFQIARQSRMLASGETLQEVARNVEAAGYVFRE